MDSEVHPMELSRRRMQSVPFSNPEVPLPSLEIWSGCPELLKDYISTKLLTAVPFVDSLREGAENIRVDLLEFYIKQAEEFDKLIKAKEVAPQGDFTLLSEIVESDLSNAELQLKSIETGLLEHKAALFYDGDERYFTLKRQIEGIQRDHLSVMKDPSSSDAAKRLAQIAFQQLVPNLAAQLQHTERSQELRSREEKRQEIEKLKIVQAAIPNQ